MLLILAVLLAVAWALGFVVFHVSSFALHILLVAAVIGVIVHFARGSRGRRYA